MLLHKGDFVRFIWNGQCHHGYVREDERPGVGLVDIESDQDVWHGVSRRAITPLPREQSGAAEQPAAAGN